MAQAIRFQLNGQDLTVQAPHDQSLLDCLRSTCSLKATRLGC